MSQYDDGPPAHEEPRNLVIELYKIAVGRLNFQDEYLFKISAVFLTANGALAALAGWAAFRANEASSVAIAAICGVGIGLAVIWSLWIRHNDYWHAVWTGTLRELERKLGTDARLFDANHKELAKKGDRSICCVYRGHYIAQGVPAILGLAWLVVLVYEAGCRAA